MYLEVDEGFHDHPKTLRLCALMKSPEADAYPPRLWRWAVRSAPGGDLTRMDPFEIEMAMRYSPLDGRLYAAMVAAGFIDDIDGAKAIHDWMVHTGGAIAAMAAAATRKRAWRAHKDGDCGRDPKRCDFCARRDPRSVKRAEEREGEQPPPRRAPVQTSLAAVAPAGYPADFDRLWEACGKTGNKAPAHRAWRRQGCPAADLVIAGWRRAEAHDRRWQGTDPHIPHLSTWLHARGWEDDASQSRRNGSPVVAPRTAQTVAAMQEFVSAHTKGAT